MTEATIDLDAATATPVITEAALVDPWNPRNVAIGDDDITALLTQYGNLTPAFLSPNGGDLFRQACVHASYTTAAAEAAVAAAAAATAVTAVAADGSDDARAHPPGVQLAPAPPGVLPLAPADSERMEFLGDSLLGAVVAGYLFERYPDEDEGFYTRLRTGLVNNAHLASLCAAMGLPRWLVCARYGDEVAGWRANGKVLGSLLEAWVAAIYLDATAAFSKGSGWERVQAFVVGVLEAHVDFATLVAYNANHKAALFAAFRSRFGAQPQFPLLSRAVNGEVTVGVRHPTTGELLSTAASRNRKAAEQAAARGALLALGVQPSERPGCAPPPA